MHRKIFRRVAGLALLCLLMPGGIYGQSGAPVRIAFDKQAKRVDLLTGKTVPAVSQAQCGSIRFYLGRLDTPDDFFNFFHDGFKKANISDLERMEKIQGKFAIWRLRYKSGSKNTPRVQHQAVSFVPINADGKPAERVYLRLDDLSLIDFRE
ncbi:MAG: hypothetical protein ACYC9O_10650 [Candidatus Latescibacterota bacterium]